MDKFTKVTVGFVVQSYEKDAAGKFKCKSQEFVAGDQVDYEDMDGNTITAPEHDYQPFEMTLLSNTRIAVAIEDILFGIDVGGEQSRQFSVEIDMLKELLDALGNSSANSKQTDLGFLEAQLLEACKTITSYTMDLLYKLDDQVNFGDIEEVQQARDVVAKYCSAERPYAECSSEMMLLEQSPDYSPKTIKLHLLAEDGQLWIRPQGYGEKCTTDGEGSPVGIEIWQGRLRVIVFDNINSEDPRIINMEKARETARNKCSWCNKDAGANPVKWNASLFCSEFCLDKCRATQ